MASKSLKILCFIVVLSQAASYPYESNESYEREDSEEVYKSDKVASPHHVAKASDEAVASVDVAELSDGEEKVNSQEKVVSHEVSDLSNPAHSIHLPEDIGEDDQPQKIVSSEVISQHKEDITKEVVDEPVQVESQPREDITKEVVDTAIPVESQPKEDITKEVIDEPVHVESLEVAREADQLEEEEKVDDGNGTDLKLISPKDQPEEEEKSNVSAGKDWKLISPKDQPEKEEQSNVGAEKLISPKDQAEENVSDEESETSTHEVANAGGAEEEDITAKARIPKFPYRPGNRSLKSCLLKVDYYMGGYLPVRKNPIPHAVQRVLSSTGDINPQRIMCITKRKLEWRLHYNYPTEACIFYITEERGESPEHAAYNYSKQCQPIFDTELL